MLDGLDDAERALVRTAPAPQHAGAMKAVLTDKRFSDDAWIFERKLDGVRCVAVRDEDRVRLLSRNDLALNGRYPELAEALGAERCRRFAVDGEVVAFDGAQTSFARLAQRGRHGAGEALFAEACRKGWEGVIAKRADSRYSDKRSRDWLKFKCEHGQELVVGAFTAPKGSRTDFGALLLGYYDAGGARRYAGKVGTGLTQDTLRDPAGRMAALRRADPPFADAGALRERDVTWVEPELVAQVGFTEWTPDGRLRHPRFLGLRDDKRPREVVRER